MQEERARRNRQKKREQQVRITTIVISISSGVLLFSFALLIIFGQMGKSTDAEESVEAEIQAETESETETEEEEILVRDLTDLQEEVEARLQGVEGVWSVYIKDLSTDEVISINNQSMYAASLIKLYVMKASFENMDALTELVSAEEGIGEAESYDEIMDIMTNMIVVSDNESYNELVRLQSANHSFVEGCLMINEYISDNGYFDTGIYHTLSPSSSASEATENRQNQTSVEDCAVLLEEIYNGTCVSQEASEQMLDLLLQQQVVDKIPAGLPEDVAVANKTGETEETQHDVAIVYGPVTDYILCVMSSEITAAGNAMTLISEISSDVYEYLNAV